MILKSRHKKESGAEFFQLLKNSFESGKTYQNRFIKQELLRFYDILDINHKEAVTAQTIRKFFNVRECTLKGQRAMQLLEPLI